MKRLLGPVALVAAFVVGLVAGGIARPGPAVEPEVDTLRETVALLRHQVRSLQARLRGGDDLARLPATAQSEAARGLATGTGAARAFAGPWLAAAGPTPELRGPDGVAARSPQAGPAGSSASAAPATVEGALERFRRYLDTVKGSAGRERWEQARELVDDLRAMGHAGAQVLMQVLARGGDSEERRAAARLLGTLQVPEALPLLQDIIDRDEDMLLRRAAASGLRQLQTPESIPVMERLVANPAEDRFVRLSAAYGLAESGRPAGVSALAQIFEESSADGRGRALAFRALAALNDERPLPFMRWVATSQAEPSYRLQAIHYVAARGDRQALGALQLLVNAPNEQPSIRDAAAQALAAISGR